MDAKKHEIQQYINDENGIDFAKNIPLDGYVFYKGDSFIAFNIVEVKLKKKTINTAIIQYIYVTSKNSLVKLLSFTVNFFAGNNVKFIYLKEHKRQSNIVKKYFSTLGFTIKEYNAPGTWQYPWTSTNGFDEDDILEAYL